MGMGLNLNQNLFVNIKNKIVSNKLIKVRFLIFLSLLHILEQFINYNIYYNRKNKNKIIKKSLSNFKKDLI